MNIITKSFHMAFEPLFGKFTGNGNRPAVQTPESTIDSLVRTLGNRRRTNRAIRDLSKLSNETLRDIGIERGNIPELVESLMDEQRVEQNNNRRAQPARTSVTIPVAGGSVA